MNFFSNDYDGQEEMSRRNYSSLPPSEVFTCHTNGFTKGLCSITEKAVQHN